MNDENLYTHDNIVGIPIKGADTSYCPVDKEVYNKPSWLSWQVNGFNDYKIGSQ